MTSVAASQALNSLVLEVLRCQPAVAEAGDALVADLGMTGARWRVLGAVRLSPSALTAPAIAARMGISRQAVQRLVNAMVGDGLLAFETNPGHARSPRIILTPGGATAYEAADARRRAWAAELAEGLDAAALTAATELLAGLRRRLAAA